MKFAGEIVPPGYWSIGIIRSRAPASRCRSTLLARVSGPHRYVPGAGIRTVPPLNPLVTPPAAAAVMACWMAVVLVYTPSPRALYGALVTVITLLVLMAGSAGAAL